MTKSFLCVSASFVLFVFTARANYTSPGTGVKYSLASLAAAANGDVTVASDAFFVNDTVTISLNDTLAITSDAVVKFAAGTFFDVNGTIVINPPTGVLFTAQSQAAGYLGMRINTSPASVLKKLTFEYAVSLRLADCSISVDGCVFQYNNNSTNTTFGNGAIALFRSNSVITNCAFLHNQRAAIQGGANISNAPAISNCLFLDNNTTNQNVPQINLGTTGTDTAKIINNQILRASVRSGGIGFLPLGDVFAVISGNVIKNNRYGITFNGGANINSLVSYNVIDSNNTEGNPLSGGSGIAFSGGTATSHQNVIVTGNYIRWNLWGITVGATTTGGGAKPNLGDLSNTDTTDDGKNWIYGNTNDAMPRIDLYNNNVDNIAAQNNYWGSNNADTVEARIFHKVDNASLGLVNYAAYRTLPVELIAFNAGLVNKFIVVSWRTSTENNSDHFAVEKSEDGRGFYQIGKVEAAGNLAADKDYRFVDKNVLPAKQFYRLKLADKDGTFNYSKVVTVTVNEETHSTVKLFPTVFSPAQPLTAELVTAKAQPVFVQVIAGDGKVLQRFSKVLIAGINTFAIHVLPALPGGMLRVRFTGDDINEAVSVFKN